MEPHRQSAQFNENNLGAVSKPYHQLGDKSLKNSQMKIDGAFDEGNKSGYRKQENFSRNNQISVRSREGIYQSVSDMSDVH